MIKFSHGSYTAKQGPEQLIVSLSIDTILKRHITWFQGFTPERGKDNFPRNADAGDSFL